MKQLCCFKGLGQYAGQAWWPTLKYSDADNTIASLLFLTIKDDSKNILAPKLLIGGLNLQKSQQANNPHAYGA